MAAYLAATALLLSWAGLATAQDGQTTWGAVVMTMHGEKSPGMTSAFPDLTPLGAQQGWSQGQMLRTRYLQGPGTNITHNYPIRDLPVNAIDNSKLYMLSADDDYMSASAQAFMQGVYPPLGQVYVDDESILSNNSVVQYPLGGYQYPTIDVIQPLDYYYVWIDGTNDCTEYLLSANDYSSSKDFNDTYTASGAFYRRVSPAVFDGIVPPSLVTYGNAYPLWEFAQFQYTHNHTVAQNLAPGDLEVMRNYASQMEFARNGNLSASGTKSGDEIRTVAGQTFAGAVLVWLGEIVGSHGNSAKLSLLFGKHQVFMAFFALAGLSQRNDNFKSIPEPGSTMVFELFSKVNSTTFPSPKDLWVRFLFRNGTDPSQPLTAYPLFGNGNSQTDLMWGDFLEGIENIANADIGSWCTSCGSLSFFCEAFVDNSNGGGSGSGGGSGGASSPSHGMTLQVAGVIGAVVTLGVVAIVLVSAMCCCGIRFHRHGSHRQSSLGGFKGAEKLASDTDLTVAKVNGATIVRHERVGSWELGDAKKGSMDKDLERGTGAPSVGGSPARESGTESIDRVVSMADYSKRDEDDEVNVVSAFAEPVRVAERV